MSLHGVSISIHGISISIITRPRGFFLSTFLHFFVGYRLCLRTQYPTHSLVSRVAVTLVMAWDRSVRGQIWQHCIFFRALEKYNISSFFSVDFKGLM